MVGKCKFFSLWVFIFVRTKIFLRKLLKFNYFFLFYRSVASTFSPTLVSNERICGLVLLLFTFGTPTMNFIDTIFFLQIFLGMKFDGVQTTLVWVLIIVGSGPTCHPRHPLPWQHRKEFIWTAKGSFALVVNTSFLQTKKKEPLSSLFPVQWFENRNCFLTTWLLFMIWSGNSFFASSGPSWTFHYSGTTFCSSCCFFCSPSPCPCGSYCSCVCCGSFYSCDRPYCRSHSHHSYSSFCSCSSLSLFRFFCSRSSFSLCAFCFAVCHSCCSSFRCCSSSLALCHSCCPPFCHSCVSSPCRSRSSCDCCSASDFESFRSPNPRKFFGFFFLFLKVLDDYFYQFSHRKFDGVEITAPPYRPKSEGRFTVAQLNAHEQFGLGARFLIDSSALWDTLSKFPCPDCGSFCAIDYPYSHGSFLSCHLVCDACALSIYWCNTSTENNFASGILFRSHELSSVRSILNFNRNCWFWSGYCRSLSIHWSQSGAMEENSSVHRFVCNHNRFILNLNLSEQVFTLSTMYFLCRREREAKYTSTFKMKQTNCLNDVRYPHFELQ